MRKVWHRSLLLAPVLLTSVACIEHRVAADLPDGFHSVIDDRIDPPASAAMRRGPLPQEMRVTAWQRLDDGTLLRADTQTRSPLLLWQRFPADFFADILPWIVRCEDHQTMTPLTLPVMSEQDLSDEAAAHGYASRQTEQPGS